MLAEVYTLDTTYQLQLLSPPRWVGDDQNWSYVSQAEYTDRQDCLDEVARMYGGAFNTPGQFRIIRHERHVES